MDEQGTAVAQNSPDRPTIIGDVVFGDAASPVAVCTLGSRSLLSGLAGRPEIAVAGRVFTENVGVERMVQNLLGFRSVRFMIVCGRETSHRVGETILALHRAGLDEGGRVIGSSAPEPVMPNLTSEQVAAFQAQVAVVDLIGVVDAETIVAQARALAEQPRQSEPERAARAEPIARSNETAMVVARRAPSALWQYDPAGYLLVYIDRDRHLLLVEHHAATHLLLTVFEGARAEDLCHTILESGAVTLLAHAAYIGRELARAEAALTLGFEYEQDRPLRAPRTSGATIEATVEDTSGDSSGDSGAP
jgi:tetrahydromethanopterin S-methyltransferase subunit A